MIESQTIRTRGPLEMRSNGLYLHGHYVEGLGLTAHTSLLSLRTNELKPNNQHYVQANDVLFVLTGFEQVEDSRAEQWRSAYLIARHQLSELVEVYDRAPDGYPPTCPHPVSLALCLVEGAAPFLAALEQCRGFLRYVAQFPVCLTDAAHLFAASLIAMEKLDDILERFEQTRLTPIVERVIEGQSFLNAIQRAHQTFVYLCSLVFGEKEEVSMRKIPLKAVPIRRDHVLIPAAITLVGLAGLCAWQWMGQRGVSLSLEFRWYDLWRGIYVRPHKPDENIRHLYWCPIWCVAIHMRWPA